MNESRSSLSHIAVALLVAVTVAVVATVGVRATARADVTAAGAPAPSAPLEAPRTAPAPANDLAADEATASEVLSELQARYEHLDDVTVRIGSTPAGEEAVAYYEDGEIVISSRHTVSIEKILAHEVWHVIDWRDNGRLDWGEDLPPSSAADYLRD